MTKLTPEMARRLVESAARLNEVSDDLNKQFQIINLQLKALNIGIHYEFIIDDNLILMYGRNNDKWELMVSNKVEQWGLTHAPRHMRIKVINFIPAFLEGFVNEINLTSQQIEQVTKRAELMISGINK